MTHVDTVVLVSAGAEWRSVRKLIAEPEAQPSPYGEFFVTAWNGERWTDSPAKGVIFLHGGWGKIAAAGSTQYAIDRWQPRQLVNLGTCGGFEGEIERGEIVLAERTLVYDIIEQMIDYESGIAHYVTTLDLSWLPEQYPEPVRRTLLVSADRDLLQEQVPELKAKFGAVAGDWESGAIAYVASRNRVPVLILRGVSDLVGSDGGEAYGNLALFEQATDRIMARLIRSLPAWLPGHSS